MQTEHHQTIRLVHEQNGNLLTPKSRRIMTSRFVCAVTCRPIWYTSMSELSTSFLTPADCRTCSHMQVSLSSALLCNVSSVCGWEWGVTASALLHRTPSNTLAVTKHWLCLSRGFILWRKYCDRKSSRWRLHFLQLITFSRYYHVWQEATTEVITCHRIGLIPVELLTVLGATLCAVWIITQQVNLSSHLWHKFWGHYPPEFFQLLGALPAQHASSSACF